jgi:TolB-like protein/Flp pilus assembly protein TadD
LSFLNELKRRNVLRVGAAYIVGSWLLIQVAETIFPLFGFGDAPARLVVIMLAIAFIPSMIFSWVFEITPEGLKRDAEVTRERSIIQTAGKKLDRIILVVLALALGYFMFDRMVLTPERETEIAVQARQEGVEQAREEARLEMFSDKSVAVLPFVNRSMQTKDEHFTDGIHDELLTRLSQIAMLRVISRTSVEKYRDTELSIPEIARELSVSTILEGAVQRVDDQVRINVQLINAHTDEHLWAETFDRQLTTANIFSIQTEVAKKIANFLQATLTSEEKLRVASVPTDNYEAYEALLKGHRALKQGTMESVYEAIGFYQRALALEPGFAQAYLAMADAYLVAVEERGVADTEGLQKAEEFALKALQLDASLGGAYFHLGRVERRSRRFEEAEKYYQQGIEFEPGNSGLHHGMGLTLRLQGRALESVPYYDQAIRLDPLSPSLNESRGSLLRDLGRFEDAENQYQNTLLIDPEFVNTHWGLGTLYWCIGQPELAIEWFGNAVRLKPYSDKFRTWLALMFLELGQDEQAQLVIDEAMSVVLPEENDVNLMNELLRIYNGQDISGLPDGRQFMSRVWYGSIVDLPLRALLKGEFQQAVDQYEKSHPGIMNGQVTINGANYRAAIYVAFALKQLGQDERAAELLDQIEAFIKNIQRLGIRGYWISDVQIQVIRNDHTASLESLKQAVNEGWRNIWRFYLLHDPILEKLHTNPEFQAIVFRIEQDVLNKIGEQ